MTDHSNMQLGKHAAKHDARTLAAANYLSADLPVPPVKVDYTKKMTGVGSMLNDKLGDCTCASVGHIRQAWTAENGNQQTFTDPQILQMYEDVGGYVPGDDLTDSGAVELDVLNRWRQTGFFGDQIMAFMALEPQNKNHIMQAVFLFGGVYAGVALPISAQKQDVWHVTPGGASGSAAAGSWGGHAIPILGYNATGPVCCTWGSFKQMTWNWFFAYCDESYAILSGDWAQPNKVAPSGFSLDNLKADLKLVTA